jgi:hypothetical protein
VAVRLARGALSYLKRNDGNLCLQLRAVDHDRAAGALAAASRLIVEIPSAHDPDGPAVSYISEPLRLPDGPALMIDMADEPARLLRRVADILVAEAEAAGLGDAEVGPPRTPRRNPFWGEGSPEVAGAVYPELLLRAQKFTTAMSIPEAWVDPLGDWLLQSTPADSPVWAAIVALPFQVPGEAVKSMLSPPAGGIVSFMAGETVRRRVTYSAHIWEAILGFSGSAMGEGDLHAAVEGLQEVARSLAPHLDYAALDYRKLGGPSTPGGRSGISAVAHRGQAPSHPRLLLPDVFCWQILSPEHICLLGQPPAGARPLDGDRYDVAFGNLLQWQEDAPSHAELRTRALAVLDPLPADRIPHMVWVNRKQNDWGPLSEIKSQIETALPGGQWVSPRDYDQRSPDHPLSVRVDRSSVIVHPAGEAAAALARQLVQLFPGEVQERAAMPRPP